MLFFSQPAGVQEFFFNLQNLARFPLFKMTTYAEKDQCSVTAFNCDFTLLPYACGLYKTAMLDYVFISMQNLYLKVLQTEALRIFCVSLSE